MHVMTEKTMYVMNNAGVEHTVPYTYETVTMYNMIAGYASIMPNDNHKRTVTHIKLCRTVFGFTMKQACAFVHDAQRNAAFVYYNED